MTPSTAPHPPSKIISLSSGEFVGMIADDPTQKIELKSFHAAILNDHEGLQQEQKQYKPVPIIRDVTSAIIHRNYEYIRQEISDLIDAEMERIINDPQKANQVLTKK